MSSPTGAPPPSTPNASAQAPTAAKGAAAPTEGQPGTEAAAPVATPPPAPDPRLEELAVQTRKQAQAAAKLAQQRRDLEAKMKEFEAKEKAHKEWEARRADRLRNPDKYLAQDYGENWYDKLTEYRANGAPTSALVASEVDERFGQLQQDLEKREAALQEKLKEFETKAAERERQDFENGVHGFLKSNAEKYPLLTELGMQSQVLATMRAHFEKTMKQGPDGEMLPGELLTADEAAAKVEAEIAALGERIAKRSKPAPTPAPTEATAGQRSEPAQRRALSTSMTASSTAAPRSPAKDDRERLQRAMAAWDAVEASRR